MSEIDKFLDDPAWNATDSQATIALAVTERVRPESVFVEEDVLWDARDTLEPLIDNLFACTTFHDHSDEQNHYGYVVFWEN